MGKWVWGKFKLGYYYTWEEGLVYVINIVCIVWLYMYVVLCGARYKVLHQFLLDSNIHISYLAKPGGYMDMY